jgi:GTP-binding protein EngB required for normal cell division/uncharacterized protein (DUF697 family)
MVALGIAALLLTALYFFPQFARNYHEMTALSPRWGRIYLGLVLMSLGTLLAIVAAILYGLRQRSERKGREQSRHSRDPREMSEAEKRADIQEHLANVAGIAAQVEPGSDARQSLEVSLSSTQEKLAAEKLEIVAFGAISSGKSAILNALAGREAFATDVRGGTTQIRNEVPWPGFDKVVLVDTPGLGEVGGSEHERTARDAARDADLVLLVVDGPLREFERQLLEQLAPLGKRVLVVLCKSDWFREGDQETLLAQLREQTRPWLTNDDVVTVQAQPVARLRTRVLTDGTEQNETVTLEPDIEPLACRMLTLVRGEGKDLLLANLLLRCRGLVASAREKVRSSLDRKAIEIIDRSMWQAGAAAALSPLPILDVAAAMTLNTKMAVDLARVYHQPLDLESAGRLLGELGKNLLSILGSTVAAPMAGSLIASLFKTVPGIGTLTGGAIQGLTQALMTRWTGRVLMVYFQNEMQAPQGWAEIARQQWQSITQPAELASLVRQGATKLLGGNRHE